MTEETAGTQFWDHLDIDSECMPRSVVAVLEDYFAELEREVAALTTQRDDYKADYFRRHKDAGDEMEARIAAEAQRDELQKRIGYTAVPVVAGGANLSERLRDARRGIWQDICTVPNCDDILWFCRGDTFDGPRPPEIDDADYWDWWCYAEPPALPETGTAQATECETNGTELRAELDAAKRALAEKLAECEALCRKLADDIDMERVPNIRGETAANRLADSIAALAAKSLEQEGK